MEPGRPVVTGSTDNGVVLELTQLFGKNALEREEEEVATIVGRRTGWPLDEVCSDERGVIADGDAGWQGRMSTDLFFVAIAFRPFSDRIVDLLFVQQLVKLLPSVRRI